MELQTFNYVLIVVNVLSIYVIMVLYMFIVKQRAHNKFNDKRIERMTAHLTNMMSVLKYSKIRLNEIDSHLNAHCPEHHIYNNILGDIT
jgi:hypothetical protein